MEIADRVSSAHLGVYTVFDMMNSVLGTAEPDAVQANSTEYIELLNAIRDKISQEHANTLNGLLTNPHSYNILMPIILTYVTDYVNTSNDITLNINRTAERIYQDMAGFGILTPYLKDPTVEEININSWNAIEIIWSNRSKLLEETFSSPQECVDIIKKMVRLGGVHIDYSQPIIDSFIGDGTRISATLPPVNAESVGATASIRKQTYKNVTKEKYLELGFATEKVWDLLELAVNHNISLGLAGSPGAGKTTLMTCLLRGFMKAKGGTGGNNRICTIEEAREIELSELEKVNPGGGQPRMISRVLQFNTTQGEVPVTARRLIRHALRVNPQIIVPAEMRGEEAIEAVEAGLTGVQIVSSFHAWGAKDGYIRIQSMCQMGHGTTSESALLSMIIRAFPMMVFIKKDDDGVRRVHEIFEATGVEDGHVVGNTLFRFVRTKVEENSEGRIVHIYGSFVQLASISKSLRRLLIQNGAKKSVVDQYYFEGENPNDLSDYEEGNVEVVTIESIDDSMDETPSEDLPNIPLTNEDSVSSQDTPQFQRANPVVPTPSIPSAIEVEIENPSDQEGVGFEEEQQLFSEEDYWEPPEEEKFDAPVESDNIEASKSSAKYPDVDDENDRFDSWESDPEDVRVDQPDRQSPVFDDVPDHEPSIQELREQARRAGGGFGSQQNGPVSKWGNQLFQQSKRGFGGGNSQEKTQREPKQSHPSSDQSREDIFSAIRREEEQSRSQKKNKGFWGGIREDRRQ